MAIRRHLLYEGVCIKLVVEIQLNKSTAHNKGAICLKFIGGLSWIWGSWLFYCLVDEHLIYPKSEMQGTRAQ